MVKATSRNFCKEARLVAINKCTWCGKVCFCSEEEAYRRVLQISGMTSAYQCDINDKIWHITRKKPRYEDERIRSEYMVQKTAKMLIVEYAQQKYEQLGDYRLLAREIPPAYPTISKGTLTAAFAALKKEGFLIPLGEFEETKAATFGPKAQYHALKEILEKVTEPKQGESVMAVPSPLQVSAQELKSTLGEILAKVDGLGKGYVEIVTKLNDQTELLHTLNTKADAAPIPASVSNSEDYRRGLQDGIRMAVEMGIMLKPVV